MSFQTLAIILGILFILILLLSDRLAFLGWILKKQNKKAEGSRFTGAGYALLAVGIIGLSLAFYTALNGTPYEAHVKSWMNLMVRWVHITFGIAWIGASFYFVFLENSLNRTKNLNKGTIGNLWAVHGGGFYYLEKYKSVPDKMPEELHWFKYEAYFTWLSGFILLCVVYYLNAKTFLIDPNVHDMSPAMGIGISLGSLLYSWILYDQLCKSPFARNGWLFAFVGFILVIGLAYFYTEIFSDRAAYIHVGAVIGTCMAGNVFFNIIPAQKIMVACAERGEEVDPKYGQNALQRSMHNNYFTLPILFIMISNHFPATFSHEKSWLVLAGISLASALFKHFLNVVERGQYALWFLPLSIVMMLGLTFVTAPKIPTGECKSEVSFVEVYSIIQERCYSCHATNPTDPDWSAPPNGVKYETPQDVQAKSEKIMERVVITKNMPQNNKTGMLPEEREVIRCWIEQGAKIE